VRFIDSIHLDKKADVKIRFSWELSAVSHQLCGC